MSVQVRTFSVIFSFYFWKKMQIIKHNFFFIHSKPPRYNDSWTCTKRCHRLLNFDPRKALETNLWNTALSFTEPESSPPMGATVVCLSLGRKRLTPPCGQTRACAVEVAGAILFCVLAAHWSILGASVYVISQHEVRRGHLYLKCMRRFLGRYLCA